MMKKKYIIAKNILKIISREEFEKRVSSRKIVFVDQTKRKTH